MLYLGLWHLRPPAPVAGFYALGGANILQIGSADGDFSFGMFSPVAEVGLTINASKEIAKGLPLLIPAMVTVGARIEYALRFTHQPHEGFLTLNVGYAVGIGPN